MNTCEAESVGSSPVTSTGTSGLITKRSVTVASLTGRVKVIWNEVAGETRSPLCSMATILPDVGEPDWNEVWISAASPKPSWSEAAGATSTV